MRQYFNAIAAVTDTDIPKDVGIMNIEYQSNEKDSKVLTDIKKSRRHNNASEQLKKELLCIVPEAQIESIPGLLKGGETCNFEIFGT